jgi:hypothetical protein
MVRVAACIALVLACEGKREAGHDAPAPSVRPTNADARVARLPHLTAAGLGGLDGDTPFRLAEVRAAVPELDWERSGEQKIVAKLDGKPAAVVRGFRFVTSIEIRSPAIPLDVGAAIGTQASRLRASVEIPSCSPDVVADSEAEREHATLCVLAAHPTVALVFDGACPTHLVDHPDLLDSHSVESVVVATGMSPAMTERLSHPPPSPPVDPALAHSDVLIDKRGIHPISDVGQLSAAALARLLPKLDIVESPAGTLVASKDGVVVLRAELVSGRPRAVVVFDGSFPNKLPVKIGQAFNTVEPHPTERDLWCGADVDPRNGFCYFRDSSRIALRITALQPLAPYAVHNSGGFAGDAVVAAVEWTAPSRLNEWPIVGDDGLGPLTREMIAAADYVRIQRAMPAFDLVATPMAFDSEAFQLRLAGKTVLRYEDINGPARVTFDPRFRMPGGVGVGSTLTTARMQLGQIDCSETGFTPNEPKAGEPGYCRPANHPRFELIVGPGATPDARKITSFTWYLDPTPLVAK